LARKILCGDIFGGDRSGGVFDAGGAACAAKHDVSRCAIGVRRLGLKYLVRLVFGLLQASRIAWWRNGACS